VLHPPNLPVRWAPEEGVEGILGGRLSLRVQISAEG
jgi:hypothetical protein